MATKDSTTATKPKTPKSVKEPKANSAANTSAKEAELEALRSENASIKAQLDSVQNQLAQFLNVMQMMNRPVAEEEKDIKVTSLEVGQLVLSTTGKGDGIHYNFDKQFKSLIIPESDLKKIIKAMPRATENGLFFISDEEFVHKNGLTFVYRNIMDAQGFKGFFEKDYKEAMELFNGANDAQKEIICSMVTDKLLNGEEVDANILRSLGKATGKNFMDIIPLEELKE